MDKRRIEFIEHWETTTELYIARDIYNNEMIRTLCGGEITEEALAMIEMSSLIQTR